MGSRARSADAGANTLTWSNSQIALPSQAGDKIRNLRQYEFGLLQMRAVLAGVKLDQAGSADQFRDAFNLLHRAVLILLALYG